VLPLANPATATGSVRKDERSRGVDALGCRVAAALSDAEWRRRSRMQSGGGALQYWEVVAAGFSGAAK
jgi:hypothetical protein